jgi:hypothetical protein
MKRTRNIALLVAVMVFGFCLNSQAISLTVGSGDFYVNVGDYDYLPYAMTAYPGSQFSSLNFRNTMDGYGSWLSLQPFGQVWRPYAANDWRPYTQGHWAYTQYGPTWVGYEPWAWAGYHYGNWAFTRQHGWIWIPGYEWHPGRVAWSQGYDSIGWMPMPPSGYDYSRGYLTHVGPTNQFTYYDDDFSVGFGFGNNDYYYGGPYYDPRYRNMYYNNDYLNLAGLLWTFIDPNHFTSDNYAPYYYGGDYARYLFDRRLVRISTRPLDRVVVQRLVRQEVPVRQVRTNQIQIDGRRVRVVAVEGAQDKIRRHANEVVREVIAPAYAEKGKTFKGEKARNRAALKRALNLEKAQPRVETVTTEQIVREAKAKHERREQQRAQIKERKREAVTRLEKEGRVKEKRATGVRERETESERERSTRVEPTPDRRPAQQQQERRQQERDVQTPRPAQEETERRNRPTPQEENERRNRPNPQQQNDDNDRRQQNIKPDTDDNVQQNIDRERQQSQQEAESRQQNAPEKKQDDAEAKKAKSKKQPGKDKDKDKDKKQNQDEEPPQN